MSDAAAQLEALVAEFARLTDDGDGPTAESFARAHPRHAPRLLEALHRLEETLARFPGGNTGLPATIGRWKIAGELGRGGMGLVLEGSAKDGEEPVAIKLLPMSAVLRPHALERFRRESEALNRLRHPSIVGVHEIGSEGGTPYMVMDLVRGQSLAELIDDARSSGDGGRGVSRVGDAVWSAGLVARVADAVQSAHEEGVLHRDLKPGNVMVTDADSPMLLDFGLVSDEQASTLTGTGDLVGTPAYMAPEQALGRQVDRRTDVYGLGAILYELLTLRPIHGGADTTSTIRSVLMRPIMPARSLCPSLDKPLACIVHKATAFRPADRYATAAELDDDLEAWIAGRSISARPLGVAGRVASLFRYHRLLMAIVTFALLAIGVGLLGMLNVAASREEEQRLRRAEDLVALAVYDGTGRRHYASAVDALRALDAAHPWVALVEPLARGREVTKDAPDTGAGLATALHHLAARRWDQALDSIENGFDPKRANVLEIAILARAARRANRSSPVLTRLLESPAAAARSPLAKSGTGGAILGHRAAKAGRHDRAVAHYERGAQLQPAWARFHLHAARARQASGMPTAEIGRLAWAEGGKAALSLWARYLDSRGHHAEARAAFRKLLAEGADPVDTLWHIASSFDRQHDLPAAEGAYQQVLARDPRHVFSLFNLAWMYSGLCGNPRCTHEHMSRAADARAMLLRALRADGGRSREMAVHIPEVARAAGCQREVLDWIAAEIARDPQAPTVGRLRTIAAEISRKLDG